MMNNRDRARIAAALILTAFVVIIVGFTTPGTNAVAQLTNTSYFQATNIGSSWSSVSMLVFLVLIGAGFLAIGWAATKLERFQSLWKAIGKAVDVVVFAVVGAIVLGCIYGAWLAFEYIGSLTGSINPMYYAYGAGGFVVSAIVGYVVCNIGEKLFKNYDAMKNAAMVKDDKKEDPVV